MKTDAELQLIASRIVAEYEGISVHAPIPRLRRLEHDAILDFVDEVNMEAELNMMKTGVLEGSHHAAINLVLAHHHITRAPSGGCKDGKCGIFSRRSI